MSPSSSRKRIFEMVTSGYSGRSVRCPLDHQKRRARGQRLGDAGRLLLTGLDLVLRAARVTAVQGALEGRQGDGRRGLDPTVPRRASDGRPAARAEAAVVGV